MTDRCSPTRVLKGAIAELEREFATALAACPQRQRFEVEALRARLERLKAEAGSRWGKASPR
jgi:hypothetical protein